MASAYFELLVVVAILLTIAAISLPAIANSIKAGNESSAASTLRNMSSAEQSYRTAYGLVAPTAKSMGDGGNPANCASGVVSATAACDITDSALTNATTGADVAPGADKSGYFFSRGLLGTGGYIWVATPDSAGALAGRRQFCNLNGTMLESKSGVITGLVATDNGVSCGDITKAQAIGTPGW